jgi:hypothetical protein
MRQRVARAIVISSSAVATQQQQVADERSSRERRNDTVLTWCHRIYATLLSRLRDHGQSAFPMLALCSLPCEFHEQWPEINWPTKLLYMLFRRHIGSVRLCWIVIAAVVSRRAAPCRSGSASARSCLLSDAIVLGRVCCDSAEQRALHGGGDICGVSPRRHHRFSDGSSAVLQLGFRSATSQAE